MKEGNTPTLDPLFEASSAAPQNGTSTEAEKSLLQARRVTPESPLHRQVKPWPEPVEGAQLLDDIVSTMKRYVVAEDATIHAAALWVIHTWLMDVWTVSPIANITAPEMRCGKTLFLQTLGELVYRPLSTSSITPAALFRTVNETQPTLLIDEVDSFLKGNDDARGILNTGLYKSHAYVTRCSSDGYTATQFSVWCAKALCGIGSLAETLADRSIVLRLRRKLTTEITENLRRSDPSQWSALRSRILRWTDEHRETLTTHAPIRIPSIHDRANDCWEPMLTIAEIAGGPWPSIARTAAVALQESGDDAPSAGVELLRDIRQVFDRSGRSKLYSSEILTSLTTLGRDLRWSRWENGRALSPFQLAKMLREFGIQARAIRIGDSAGKNGYDRSWFDDAFARYLPSDADADQTLQQARRSILCGTAVAQGRAASNMVEAIDGPRNVGLLGS